MLPFFLIFFLWFSPACAQEKGTLLKDLSFVEVPHLVSPYQETQDLNEEDNDPFEPLNRFIFLFNDILDMVLLDPLSRMYKDLVPEFARERIEYLLRNLGEPVVFANNLLQGDLEAARISLGRFVVNSTLGLGGLFDVSTDWDLPYKREDFGLTLSSWGIEAGPYLVLPVLGPSTARDAWGKVGDYALDPFNRVFYYKDKKIYPYIRTGVSGLNEKAASLDFIGYLRKNSIDPYATLRAWYYERRKSLTCKKTALVALESPQPEDEIW